MRLSRHMPLFILGSIVLMWGYLFIPGKVGVGLSSAFLWSGIRTFPAYVLLLCLLLLLRRPLRPQALGLTALVGALQVGGFVGFSSAALVTSGAGHTAMLANTWQLWILAMAWVVLQERLRGLQWSALVVGVVGMVLIVEPWRLQGVVSSLFALAAALCFAGGAVVAKVLRRRHEVDLLSFTVWQGLLGSLPLVVLAAVFPGDGVQWSAAFVWSLAYSVLIGTALAQVLWLHALHLLPATTVGFANLATPIVSVLVAWLQLSERPSAAEFAGMLLVVAALGLTAASARGTGSTGTRRRVGETLCSEDPPCSDRRVPSGG